MFKSLTRLNTKKVEYFVELRNWNLEMPGLTKAMSQVSLNCKRGKMSQKLDSATGSTLTPAKPSISIEKRFVQKSMFYVHKKSGKAQKKVF